MADSDEADGDDQLDLGDVPDSPGDDESGTSRALNAFTCLNNGLEIDSHSHYPGRLCYTVIPGAPVAKKRPRFTKRGHAYHDPADKAAEEKTGWILQSMIRNQQFTGNVGLVCIFYRPDRRRIDGDNMLKHILDAANSIVFQDDSQVTATLGIVEYDKNNPRTIVLFGDHVSTMKRGTAA